jgi:rhodanese-related sulfurtransferase
MKMYRSFTSFVVFLLLASSCTSGSGSGSLNPTEFKNSLGKKNTVLIDVRTPEEFSEGYIAGAILINFEDSAFVNTMISTVPKDADVLLYCRSGRRSGIAKTQLLKLGYLKVAHLEGGILAWMAKNFPLAQ